MANMLADPVAASAAQAKDAGRRPQFNPKVISTTHWPQASPWLSSASSTKIATSSPPSSSSSALLSTLSVRTRNL